jgi:hypothetical protein
LPRPEPSAPVAAEVGLTMLADALARLAESFWRSSQQQVHEEGAAALPATAPEGGERESATPYRLD